MLLQYWSIQYKSSELICLTDIKDTCKHTDFSRDQNASCSVSLNLWSRLGPGVEVEGESSRTTNRTCSLQSLDQEDQQLDSLPGTSAQHTRSFIFIKLSSACPGKHQTNRLKYKTAEAHVQM